MTTYRALRSYQLNSNFVPINYVKQNEIIGVEFNPHQDTYHILRTETMGHLAGWGVEISESDLLNYFKKEA